MIVDLPTNDRSSAMVSATFASSTFEWSPKPPLVTIALPVYNAGKFFRPAVLSLLAQTFTNWELLIFDDGSEDDSLSTISDIKDPRIRVIKDRVNRGLVARLNEAIDMAKGVYFARMDADDISYPERLARQVESLEGDSTLDLVGAKAITIGTEDQMLGLFPFARFHHEICCRPWLGFYLVHPSWMGRTKWFRKYRYAVPAPYLCEDQELLLRSHADSKFGTVDKILFAYRVGAEPNWSKLAKTRREVFAFQSRHFMKRKQWRFWLFSLFSFIARRCLDEMRQYGLSGRTKRFGGPEEDAEREWRSVVEATRLSTGFNGDVSEVRETALKKRS